MNGRYVDHPLITIFGVYVYMSSNEQVLTQEVVEQQDQITLTDEDMQKAQAEVAAAVLKSEVSWDVLKEMYHQCAQKLLGTQPFTVGVLQNVELLKHSLKDYKGFVQSFNTLLHDIRRFKDELDIIYAYHKDKSGVPGEEDWTKIFAASQAYSTLIDRFDVVVTPLMLSLIDVVRTEHGDELVIKH